MRNILLVLFNVWSLIFPCAVLSRSICLWNTQRKKAVFTQPLAHGLNEVNSETAGLIQTPRWVTALASLRYSDLIASGASSVILCLVLLLTFKGRFPQDLGMVTSGYGSSIPN